jgi:hypothetical protein
MAHGEKQLRISSLWEFARYIERKAPPEAIFRGHADANWKLIPEGHRDGVIIARQQADRVRAEKDMLRRFKLQTRSLLPQLPGDDWEWLALARHYGLPTRYLDWTENAAAALFFAVEHPNDGADSAVWCSALPSEANSGSSPFEVDNIYLYQPPHIAPRITAQRACFTVHPSDYIGRRYPWPCSLVKIIIPARARIVIRATLREHGIHCASLFPDPAGIAREIRHRYGALDDEREPWILSAEYGSERRSANLTHRLRAEVAAGRLTIQVNNQLGDPCPGEAKTLTVTFLLNGKRYTKTAREGEEVTIS